jgi:hypothetical protein
MPFLYMVRDGIGTVSLRIVSKLGGQTETEKTWLDRLLNLCTAIGSFYVQNSTDANS